MTSLVKKTLAAAGVAASLATGVHADTANETLKIETLLGQYEQALNASDTDQVMPLYAEDGVFMPQHSPSQVGAAAVRQAYDFVFANIKLNVVFDIQEIVLTSENWAIARTNSAGTVTVLATGDSGPEANQELFVFKKDHAGDWKIARYAFSTTNPPR